MIPALLVAVSTMLAAAVVEEEVVPSLPESPTRRPFSLEEPWHPGEVSPREIVDWLGTASIAAIPDLLQEVGRSTSLEMLEDRLNDLDALLRDESREPDGIEITPDLWFLRMNLPIFGPEPKGERAGPVLSWSERDLLVFEPGRVRRRFHRVPRT